MLINPRIDKNTAVIVYGISGQVGGLHTRLMRGYGTRIVAGVSSRASGGQIDGIPIFADCKSAVAATGATTCVAFVAASHLLGAIREAVAAGIRYLVTPTEGLPVHDALQAREITARAGVLWVGASTPGVAVAGQAKLGFLPDAVLRPGSLGVMSKSGTLSYEAGYRLAQRGVGTSVWVGVGGDPVKGLRYSDLVPFYAADEASDGLLIIGEIGGSEEEELAAALRHRRFPKPVYAVIAGRTAPEGVSMGHAGALIHGSHGTFQTKKAALEGAGAAVFDSLDAMVGAVAARHA